MNIKKTLAILLSDRKFSFFFLSLFGRHENFLIAVQY